MIRLKDIKASYGQKITLDNINYSFLDGKITAIVGMNGCGKSTLLKTIVGLMTPLSGQVFIDNQDIKLLSDQKRAQQIAYLPQNRNIPVISVGRMVLHGRFPYLSYPRRYKKEDYEITNHAMERIGILELKDRNMAELSGGERQKVYLAMALAQETKTILLDEPTTFLDINYQLEILKLLTDLRNEGKTVISVLHDIGAALTVTDQLVVMQAGKILMSGAPDEIYDSGILEQVFHIKEHCFFDEHKKKHYYFTFQSE